MGVDKVRQGERMNMKEEEDGDRCAGAPLVDVLPRLVVVNSEDEEEDAADRR